MSNNDRQRERPGRQVPAGLLGALVLILACEIHVDDHAIDYLSGTQWGYRIASRVASHEATACQWLCFGDSLLKLGLAPKVVEAELGLRGYNLAVAGGQAPGTYFLLRRALEAGARPRAIVVDFFPSMLATTPHFNDENWPLLTDLRDDLDLAWHLGEADEFARLAVPYLLPSTRGRTAIRFNLKLALEPSPVSMPFELRRAIRNWKANRGAEITASQPGAAHDLDTWERGFFGEFRCLPINQVYVDRFLDLAARFEIPVFWTLPPYQPILQARTERSGFDARHEAYLRNLQKRHPNLFIIDARHAGYEPGVFVDLHHLARVGTAAFSAQIGQTIRAQLREPDARMAWTTLPRYTPGPEAAPLEDAAQSRMVVWKETHPGKGRTARK